MTDHPGFNCIVKAPRDMDGGLRQQFIKLVTEGGQIQEAYVKVGLHRAELVGMIVSENTVIATCCLKNPTDSYKQGVFKSAMAPELPGSYPFELGYIATHPNYGGQGHCQTLLRSFMPLVQQKTMFSTTRKPEMVHILKKFGFIKTGQVYKRDLELYLRVL